MTNQQDPQVRALVDQFVSELTVVIRKAALEAVRDVLGESTPARRGPGRPRKAAGPMATGATGATGTKGKTGTTRKAGRPRKRGTRGRRPPEDVAALADTVLAHVRSNPGQRLEEMGRALSMDTKELKRPIAHLMAAGSLRTEGQKRGTRYYAGGGSRKATKKKAGKRKTKRKAKKTGARRKTTRKSA